MKEIIRADKQLIITTVHYTTHSIYHAHYATAFLEVLEVVAGSSRRVRRCARAHSVGSGSEIREPWDPLNLGLTEHTALHLGECSGRVSLFV